ncbi:carbohydrate ABC transporter permease [Capillibacterium thermochitinicola]|uniref:Sugar ABC transporter permease n=1 Tax=Capillibacterium thermochitinicola TaxID=2699427 RepID=A0A8J6I2Z5_9FIRM|nr:sugar ABC transporter permease [Capillibacterium thermochitinicola]MBA2133529.1 sugar ABC transporter permease [Capillibacterium thermochitinicola]
MVASKRSKVFYFCLFLLPALALYATFFIFPLIQGVTYSFTDWNGIVPEIPLSMKKGEFEQEVLALLKSEKELANIQKYYRLDATGQFYQLQNWIEADTPGEGTVTRQLTDQERKEIKRILKKVGITPIKFIGLENFREMLKDRRFLPQRMKRYLFSEFDDLPLTFKAKDFQRKVLDHIDDEEDKAFLLSLYPYNQKEKVHELTTEEMSWETEDRLRLLLSDYYYDYRWERGVIGFTLFFTFYNVIGANLLALILALILDSKLRFRNVLRSMFFLPNVISLIIVAYVWSFMFRLIFPVLTGIAVWLGSPDLAPYATLMVAVWQGCGYLMVIYLAGLQTIPGELTEAAEVDGANWFQRLLHVRFPMLMPAFTICFFYSLANSLKTFDILWALNQGGPGYATTSIVIDIYKTAFMQNRYGYATAKAILLCVIIIILTSIQLSLMKKREVEL